MPTLSYIISGVYDYLNRPSQDKLNLGLVLPLLLDAISFYTVDLQISGENWLLQSYQWTPTSKDEVVVAPRFSVPVAVEMRDADSTDEADWEGILIANVTDVQDIGREGRKAVAFYGQEPKRVKWSINPDDFQFEAKLWYEPVAVEPTAISESPRISEAFHTMLKIRTALACLPYVSPANETLAQTLLAQLGQWEAKWKQWVFTDRNAKPIIKRDFRGSRKGANWLL